MSAMAATDGVTRPEKLSQVDELWRYEEERKLRRQRVNRVCRKIVALVMVAALGLLAYDALRGIDWEWLALDGAMGKAPLGGAKTGPNPTDRAKRGRNVRFSARQQGSRSGWRTTAPTATTQSC